MKIKVLTDNIHDLEKYFGEGTDCTNVGLGDWDAFMDDHYGEWVFEDWYVYVSTKELLYWDMSFYDDSAVKILCELYKNNLIKFED